MRTKINPNKLLDKKKIYSNIFKPKKITVCLLTYVPNNIGYYNERLNILKITLDSLLKNTNKKLYDLIVLNNSNNAQSISLLKKYYNQKKIDLLINSNQNLGVINGMNLLFNIAPGEIICSIQDDIFFEKNWLEESIKIIKNFPKVGYVSTIPCRSSQNKKNLNLCRANFKNLKKKKIIWQKDWDRLYAQSVGINEKEFIKSNKLQFTTGYETKKTTVLPVSSHVVSVIEKKVLNKVLPFPSVIRNLGGSYKAADSLINIFDNKLVKLGYANLTTNGCYSIHIGNTVDETIKNKVRNLHKNKNRDYFFDNELFSVKEKFLIFIFKLPLIRNFLKYLNSMSEYILLLKTKYDAKK